MTDHIPVFDGFVRLVDHMGSDERVVQSARVSYGSGTRTKRSDEKLIRYLMTNSHTSPFEMCSVTFHIKAPIFVARQWLRHRTARVNEISARFSVMENEFYVPDASLITSQSSTNKQGRSDVPVDRAGEFHDRMTQHNAASHALYAEMIESGVSREVARMVLPVSLYTEWYWNNDLHNILHFLGLRLDERAQYEIRQYAQAVEQIIQELFPVSWSAWKEYASRTPAPLLHK